MSAPSAITDEVVKAPLIAAVVQKLDFINMSFFPSDADDDLPSALSTNNDGRRYEPGLALYTYQHTLTAPTDAASMESRYADLTPVSVLPTTIAGLDLNRADRKMYAFELEGKITINRGGKYIFALNTDAPSDVYIDNQIVASAYGTSIARNTNAQQPSAASTTLEKSFSAGLYNIRIRYFSPNDKAFMKVLFRNVKNPAFSEIPCGALFYDPATLTGEKAAEPKWSANNLVQNLTDYEKFLPYFSSTPRADTLRAAMNANVENVFVSNNRLPFVSLKDTSSLQLPESTTDYFTGADVNFSGVFTQLGSLTNGNNMNALLNELNKGRVIYNFLDPTNLEMFNNKRDVTLQIYSVNPQSKKHNTITIAGGRLTAEYAYLKTYIEMNPVQQFIARRLVLLVDLLVQIFTAFYIYELIYVDTPTIYQQYMLSITKFLTNKLVHLNHAFDAMYESGNSTAITDLYKKMNLYKSNTAELNDLSDTIRDSKSDMLDQDERLQLEMQQHKTSKTAAVATMAFATVIVAFFVILGLTPMDAPKKRASALIGLSVAVVFGLIVIFVRRYKVERFEGDRSSEADATNASDDTAEESIEGFSAATVASVDPAELQSYLSSKSKIAFERYLTEMSAMDHFARYLQNTINLALILQTSLTYNNVNYSTQKELQYFHNTQVQMENAAASLKSRHRLYDLQSKKFRSGMLLSVAIVIIVAFAMTLYIVMEGNVKARQVILITGVIAIILSVLMYFLDVQSRVRTNADKYYWGTPSGDVLHQL